MDEGYWMYNEDTDWCVRATDRGHAVIVVPDAKVWHKVSMSSGGGLTAYKVYHRLRSTLLFFTIHARWYHWLGIVPATVGRTLGFIARQLVSGRKDTAAGRPEGRRRLGPEEGKEARGMTGRASTPARRCRSSRPLFCAAGLRQEAGAAPAPAHLRARLRHLDDHDADDRGR